MTHKQDYHIVQLEEIDSDEHTSIQLETFDDVLNQRSTDIRLITNQVTDVNQTFLDLQRLVTQQTVIIDNIEKNIITTDKNVKTAVVEIKDANKYQKSTAQICCWVLCFAITLAIVGGILIFYWLFDTNSPTVAPTAAPTMEPTIASFLKLFTS